jgi:hypothetical protein
MTVEIARLGIETTVCAFERSQNVVHQFNYRRTFLFQILRHQIGRESAANKQEPLHNAEFGLQVVPAFVLVNQFFFIFLHFGSKRFGSCLPSVVRVEYVEFAFEVFAFVVFDSGEKFFALGRQVRIVAPDEFVIVLHFLKNIFQVVRSDALKQRVGIEVKILFVIKIKVAVAAVCSRLCRRFEQSKVYRLAEQTVGNNDGLGLRSKEKK